ncbi:MAG: conjugal transfer protein TraG [Gemmatimonadetes bacterium]|nr:MAG: conjugal transfer protein TraG [Gemmatimonadota bacterium]
MSDSTREETRGGLTTRRDERQVRPPQDPQGDRPLLVCLVLALVFALAAGTQYVAWRFAFHPNLGAPLLVFSAHSTRWLRVIGLLATGAGLGATLVPRVRSLSIPFLVVAASAALGAVGPVYPPYGIFVWYAANAGVATAAPVFRVAWAVVVTVGIAASLAVTTLWRRRRRSRPADSHGSAHWGDGANLRGEQGLLLGRERQRLLRFSGEGHVLTVAPTRAGKGVSAVIPNLLDYPGSVLVTDPKGENYAVTATWREALGHTVHAFDPFGVVQGEAAYNPLDLIDAASAEAVDDARLLADMLVLPGAREGEQAFWNEEARGVLTGLILHVAANAPAEMRTLTHVRELLTAPPEAFADVLKEMQASEAVGGLVARAAARLLQKATKERSGVLSTAQSHTHFLDSPRMAEVLKRSTVDFSQLKRQPMSVYLILPTDRIDAYARWLRLLIACALRATARTTGQPKERVLVLLDEFAHLGRMHPVQRDIGLAGGFGVTFWLIVQDLSQLKSTYAETWPTFLANVDVLQAFGINDWDTAEYLSKMTGESTIYVESKHQSRGMSRGPHAQRQLGSGRAWSEQGRRLLLPDEVRRLPRESALVFVKGGAPLCVERVNYLRDPEFVGRADPNPLYRVLAAAVPE